MKLIYLNGQKEDPDVTHITFPTGERHIRIRNLSESEPVTIFYNDPSGDIMKLALAVDICRRENCMRKITLVMPFVPYARQDRIATEGDPFSIRVFAQFINKMDFDQVFITDPHSDVTPALINQSVIIPQHKVAAHAVMRVYRWHRQCAPDQSKEIALVAPDLGAAKKIIALQDYLYKTTQIHFPVIQCDKKRDSDTGKITGFRILDGNPKDKHCFMVDDICDGGGTFLGLGYVIKKAGADNQSLYVTHGIFSKGTNELGWLFENIFASDSFPTTDNVQTVKLGELDEQLIASN